MAAGAELRKLKSELTSFECLNLEDLKFKTHRFSKHIYQITENHPASDGFFKTYINCVILKHLDVIEDFVNNIEEFNGREEFISKALRYHFNCIIDSYTYASIVLQH
jgi:hypothetical protein